MLMLTADDCVLYVDMTHDNFRLLLICVYMPYEGSEEITKEFIEQLAEEANKQKVKCIVVN
jgi:hypothetical protein